MVVKRNEKESIVECLYDSSNVIASTYDKATKKLIVTFNRGTQYLYKDVRLTDYTRFEIAESQGSVLNSHIKPYPATKLGDVDTAKLIEEIKSYQPRVMSKEEKDLIIMMKEFISATENKNEVDMIELNNVETLINKLKEFKNKKDNEIN